MGAYVGGIFSVILAGVSFITSGINKFYSDSSIIHELYKVKVEKNNGDFEEDFKISELQKLQFFLLQMTCLTNLCKKSG